MTRAVAALVFAWWVTAVPTHAAPHAVEPAAVAALDRELMTMSAEGFSGAVLIAEGERIVLRKAYGMLGGRAMDPTTRFWIASVSKTFTAAAVLKCRDLGLLTLNDAIGLHLGEIPADKRTITIAQLLSHKSGLPQAYAAEGLTDRVAAQRVILAQPLAHAPGARFTYSNDNYDLAAMIVEIVTKMPFEAFVAAQILAPAGPTATGFAAGPGAQAVAPTRHPLPAAFAARQWGGVGSGAMFSAIDDLLAWTRALRAGRVLSPDSVAEMFAPHAPLSAGSAGYGWFNDTTPRGVPRSFSRGNEDAGPSAVIDVYPERGVIAVALSHAGDAPSGVSYARRLQELIGAMLFP
ncbi:MAG: serine hydrolase domain-containing protein [Rhodospirillaceae bacterium]|nr:serine hydrolase domain-containing protein [Rhodospirillaceae bacterium]